MSIGKRIKQRRKELGISADKLGEILGKDRSTIFRYEKGDIENLPLDILQPIATALGTTPQYLMGWNDKTNTPEEPKLSEGEKMWLELYHRLSSDTRELIIKSFDKLDKMPEDRQKFVRDVILVAFQDKK